MSKQDPLSPLGMNTWALLLGGCACAGRFSSSLWVFLSIGCSIDLVRLEVHTRTCVNHNEWASMLQTPRLLLSTARA